jgi:thiamine-phosphate pyrophosphorylase
MRRFRDAGLYVVTSQSLSRGRATLEIVRLALEGGVKLVQLREKDMALRPLLNLAHEARALTREWDALLIMNDRLDVALAVEADGVHLGQEDFPADAARRIAPDLIIGASTHSVDEAVDAQERGASYINIGPLFPTSTKAWTSEFLGLEGLARISAHARVPFTVMGGIKRHHVADLVRAGARTIAVVTAVTAAADPGSAARDLRERILSCRAELPA